MFVFLDFLSKYVDSPYPKDNARYNSANFRDFLKNYSDCDESLRCIQIDKFLSDYTSGKIDRQEYSKYFDLIEVKVREVKEARVEYPVSQLIDINTVEQRHIEYFRDITIYNKVYELRNYAVHDYRNYLQRALDCHEPVLSYTRHMDPEREGWYNTYIPYGFIYKLVVNCYTKVREEYKELFERIFEDDTDFT
jgi:hypothetical protein